MTTSDRLLRVLDLFDLEKSDWSVEEAAKALSLATSTTYRYFASLTASGLIAPFAAGRYGLGPTIIRYDRQLRLTDPLISTAQPEMKRLALIEPKKTVVFAVGYERGRLMPLFRGSASKAILAQLPPRQLRSLYRRDPASFADAGLGATWVAVRDALRQIRVDGFVVSNSEIDNGMRGVSVPLVPEGSGLLASLNVAGSEESLPPDTVCRLAGALSEAAFRITAALQAASRSS
jgi:DNA-binding IclR family transcriptional regulator